VCIRAGWTEHEVLASACTVGFSSKSLVLVCLCSVDNTAPSPACCCQRAAESRTSAALDIIVQAELMMGCVWLAWDGCSVLSTGSRTLGESLTSLTAADEMTRIKAEMKANLAMRREALKKFKAPEEHAASQERDALQNSLASQARASLPHTRTLSA